MMKKHVVPNIVLILIGIFMLVPFVVLVIYSFVKSWTKLLPSGFTLNYWIGILSEGKVLPAVARGLLISVVPVVVTNLIVILALYSAIVYKVNDLYVFIQNIWSNENIITSLTDIVADTLYNPIYINPQGMVSDKPWPGMNIVREGNQVYKAYMKE